MTTQRHVAIFGLSADPPTHELGHGGILRAVAPLVDEVWVLPVFEHRFKPRQTPFHHRLRMCELGLAGDGVRVLDTERSVCEASAQACAAAGCEPERVGSVDVLSALCKAHPDVRFSWVLGADTFADLRAGRWKRSDEFMQRAHLFVTERAGEPPPVVEGLPQVTLLHVPGLAVASSSAARAALAAGDDAAVARLLHPAVLAYARQHGLYAS